jgi:hypothetical protein
MVQSALATVGTVVSSDPARATAISNFECTNMSLFAGGGLPQGRFPYVKQLTIETLGQTKQNDGN